MPCTATTTHDGITRTCIKTSPHFNHKDAEGAVWQDGDEPVLPSMGVIVTVRDRYPIDGRSRVR